MRIVRLLVVAIAAGAAGSGYLVKAQNLAKDYPVQPVPFTAVHLSDAFWAPKIETNRTVSIPFAFEQCETTGRVENFIRAAKALQGTLGDADRKMPGYPFDDTDIYKVIEGASYALSVRPDPKLDAYVDGLIAKIAAAQEPDGYLYPARTINPAKPHAWAGAARWQLEKVDSHELYEVGHLTEAAVAHYQATGKKSLLNVATKFADLLVNTFGPGKRAIWPGHQITEMALVKLYRVTGKDAYLNLSKFMLDVRGPDGDQGAGRTYNQSQAKPIDQTEAVGHAVRASYMYSGMADVAAMTGDLSYLHAIDAIWNDVVGKKLYITGGIGASGAGEAFGAAYELPNMTAYCETCAAIGNDYWNHRLFLLHGDAKYIDVMERTLYNGLISGVSLDGKSFFYPNVLESRGQHARAPWFGVACCPGNITRFVASVSGYQYAKQDRTIFVNLYAAGTADIALDGGAKVQITQTTKYPWDGFVSMKVSPATAATFALNVRIPGWAMAQAVPSDLYAFTSAKGPVDVKIPELRVNGAVVPTRIVNGYVRINRAWKAGDTVTLNLPMPIHRIAANDKVAADKDRVAFQRGPIVYAFEWPDNPGANLRNLFVPDTAAVTTEFAPALLGGVQVIWTRGTSLVTNAAGVVQKKETPLTAIPYYAWANRGKGEMTVWVPRVESAARPKPYPTLAMSSKVSVSKKSHLPEQMVNDGEEPTRSNRSGGSSFDWWPTFGTTEWLQYDFPQATAVSETQVFWFDDTGSGGVKVPANWRLLYKDGDQWKPVESLSAYTVERDKWNVVSFKPVTTTAVR
ncbi:MAG: glycoside hydrolase family 127 protein, partial [Acidobacteria bacterium]